MRVNTYGGGLKIDLSAEIRLCRKPWCLVLGHKWYRHPWYQPDGSYEDFSYYCERCRKHLPKNSTPVKDKDL